MEARQQQYNPAPVRARGTRRRFVNHFIATRRCAKLNNQKLPDTAT